MSREDEQMSRKKKKNRNETPIVKIPLDNPIFLIFSGISGLLLTISVIAGVMATQRIARERTAPGRVVDLVLHQSIIQVDRTSSKRSNSSSSRTKETVAQELYYPKVTFDLPDGEQKTVQLKTGSWPAAYEKGEAVTVIYEIDTKIEARIQAPIDRFMRWFPSIVTAIIALAFFVPVAVIYHNENQE
jgi:hypothetical protein